MATEVIQKIEIDNLGRLCIFPKNAKFTLIYRSAAEVHWDNKNFFLFYPKPREWTYFDWYRHIISIVQNEYNCQLIINEHTIWINVPISLKLEITKNN